MAAVLRPAQLDRIIEMRFNFASSLGLPKAADLLSSSQALRELVGPAGHSSAQRTPGLIATDMSDTAGLSGNG